MEYTENVLGEINQKELPFKSWATLAWALFWRSSIMMIGAGLSGALIGGVLGFAVGLLCGIIGYPFESIKIPLQIFSIILGLGIGFKFIILQLKWFFKTNFHDFRIAIIKKNI